MTTINEMTPEEMDHACDKLDLLFIRLNRIYSLFSCIAVVYCLYRISNGEGFYAWFGCIYHLINFIAITCILHAGKDRILNLKSKINGFR